MQQIRDSDAGRPERRQPRRPVRIPDGPDGEIRRLLSEYADALDERLEDGLRGLHRSAQQLMRQLAAEVWRAGGPEAGTTLRDNVIAALAQDDTVKGLLAHTDERYQSLRVRIAELEAAIRQLAEATAGAVKQVNRRAGALGGADTGPLAEKIDRLTTALQGAHERQRQDMARFAQRTGEGMAEIVRRVQQGVGGELERLEATIRSERELAGGAGLEAVAERMGTALDVVRADLVHRLERIEAGHSQEVQTAIAGQLEQVEAYAQRAAEGLGQMARRLETQLSAMREAADEGRRDHAGQIGSLERAIEDQREKLAAFTDRAGSGLAEVSRRIQAGFQQIVERAAVQNANAAAKLEERLGAELRTVEAEIGAVAGRTGTVIESLREDVAGRLERATSEARDKTLHVVTEVVSRQAGEQQRNLGAVTATLQKLLSTIRHAGQAQSVAIERVLRASAGRQEALLNEALTGMRSAVDEVMDAYGSDQRQGRDRSADVGAFAKRLRGMERRLGELSRELAEERSTE